MSEGVWVVDRHPRAGQDRTVVIRRDRGYEYDYCVIGTVCSDRPRPLARLMKKAQKEADRRNAATDALARALGERSDSE